MARQINKLSALGASRLKEKGLYSDGGGLNLRINESGGKFWVFRFMLNGKAREMGLGALHSVSLSDARARAAECRNMLSEGKDPVKARDVVKAQAKLSSEKERTFKECAEAYIEAQKIGWKNQKHIQQWENTLKTYVYPVFGSLHVQDVDVALVSKVLDPIWKTKTETASRVRGRIEVILDWAATRGFRQGENPARWRGHMENLLPNRSKVQRVKHQPALPYAEIGDFMAALKEQEGISSFALQFTILTASRTSETVGALWDEIDLQDKVWTIPATRIKAEREHRVPLSRPAVQILEKLLKEREKKKGEKLPWIFEGQRGRKPLSNMAMLALLERMKRTDITVHGFRSSFRDWAAEQTNYPREIAEAALAHVSGDKVETAYRRTDFFDRRRQMMDAWARYCATPSEKIAGNVTQLRRKS